VNTYKTKDHERLDKAAMREGDDNWPDVVAISADRKSRIIVSADTAPTTQWIVQCWDGCRWRSTNFCQSRIGMEIVAVFDPVLRAAVSCLPNWCPQRPVKTRAKHTLTGKSVSKAREELQGASSASGCGLTLISQSLALRKEAQEPRCFSPSGNPYLHPTSLRDWLGSYIEDDGGLRVDDFPPPDFEELPDD
jgi:hypothetical protein